MMAEEKDAAEVAEEVRAEAAKNQAQTPNEPGRTPNPTEDEPEKPEKPEPPKARR